MSLAGVSRRIFSCASAVRARPLDEIHDALLHHVVGVVRAAHDAIRTHLLDHPLECGGVEGDDVEIEVLEIVSGRMRRVHLRLGPRLPAVLDAADSPGEVSARVGEQELEVRVALEMTREDEPCGGDRGGQRVANAVRHVVGEQRLVVREIGMNEHQGAEPLRRRPEFLVLGLVQRVGADVIGDDAAEQPLAHRALEFGRRGLATVLHG